MKEQQSDRQAIIGGGVLGLTLALRLAKAGKKVTLLEKATEWGGLASGIPIGNSTVEKFYHHWFRSDTAIQNLISELGLSDKLEWLPSKVGIYQHGHTYDFSTAIDLLKFPLLSIPDRLKLGLVTRKLQKLEDYKPLESVSALDWCHKNFGNNVTKEIWEPLLRNKFGEYADSIAMSWLWARIRDRSSSRPNPLARENLGYLKGGFQLLIDKLEAACLKAGVEMLNDTQITAFRYDGKVHNLTYMSKGETRTRQFATVVATVPGPVFTKIFPVDAATKKAIDAVKYIGALDLFLELKQSVMPYYWLNINDSSFPFLVLVEHTNLVDKSNYSGNTIVYVGKYLKADDRLFNMELKDLLDLYTKYLQKINPAFSREMIRQSFIFKSPYAQHIVTTNYKIPPYETNIKGLYMANFSQIYPHDRGTNYAIEQAGEVADIILRA